MKEAKKKSIKKEIKTALKYADSIIATLREPFLVLNKNLRVVSINRSFLSTFKVTEKETIGQLLPDLSNRQWNIPKLIQLLKDILPKKTVVENYEVEHEFKQIGYRIMNLNACRLRVSRKIAMAITKSGREEELILLAIEDVTEIKKFKEVAAEKNRLELDLKQQKKLDKMKTEFISVASHQLRTPLTGIQWAAERFLRKEKLISPRGKEYLDDIQETSHRLSNLVDLLLNVSRIEEGRLSISPSHLEIVSFIESYLDECTALCDRKNITLVFKKHPKTLKANTDKSLVRYIVQSIVSNAIEYSLKGGKIEIFLEKKNNKFLFTIKDTGIGIPKKEQAGIFDKFFRGSNAKLIKTDGTGLGLYLAKQATELLGGKIWFKSAKNKGTTFYVELLLKASLKGGRRVLREKI